VASQAFFGIDSSGFVRRLFGVGDTIDGQKVKTYSVLTPVPGSTGTSRSFNADGVVTWLAIFPGGGSQVVTTAIP
jgi:hypothetical protein